VHETESRITGLFESAYTEARGSFVGLQVLDEQATEFMRLRQAAFQGHEDTARADLERRWQAIDAGLDLSHETRQAIDDLPQWQPIRDKFQELDTVLAASPPDSAKVLDAISKLQMMIGNARYRLDPTRGGQRDATRARGLFAEEGDARSEYITQLTAFEQRLASYEPALTRLGLGTTADATAEPEDTEVSPSATLSRMRRARASYDQAVTDAAAAHPDLGQSDLWSDSSRLIPAIEDANRTDRDRFDRLRYLELALQLTVDQATASLTIAPEAPPELIRQAITAEAQSAREAIQRRKMGLGLVFADEIDDIRSERTTQDQEILARTIDAAYPISHACDTGGAPQPLGPDELAALHSSDFGSDNAQTSTTEHQLAEAQHHIDPWRNALTPGVDPLKDWAHMSRVMPLGFARLTSPYNTWGSFLGFATFPSHEFATGLEPIVANLGNLRSGGTWYPVPYLDIIAVNADARTVLGPGVVSVNATSLEAISVEDMQARAETIGPDTQSTPSP
jgi:hypothetical protein